MNWRNQLQAIAARFLYGMGADVVAMDLAQLWAFYAFLKAQSHGG